jgi:hypothetical protein
VGKFIKRMALKVLFGSVIYQDDAKEFAELLIKFHQKASTYFHDICVYLAVECFCVLIQQEPAFTIETTRYGQTMLFSAVQEGNIRVVERLLALGADINKKCNGTTPLYGAFMISNHPNFDPVFVPWELIPHSDGGTKRRAECVKYIVEQGADWRSLPIRPDWLNRYIRYLARCKDASVALARVFRLKDRATKDLCPILSAMVWDTRNSHKWKK